MESRIHGDMYVRFGGRYRKTYRRNAKRRPVPSLRHRPRPESQFLEHLQRSPEPTSTHASTTGLSSAVEKPSPTRQHSRALKLQPRPS